MSANTRCSRSLSEHEVTLDQLTSEERRGFDEDGYLILASYMPHDLRAMLSNKEAIVAPTNDAVAFIDARSYSGDLCGSADRSRGGQGRPSIPG